MYTMSNCKLANIFQPQEGAMNSNILFHSKICLKGKHLCSQLLNLLMSIKTSLFLIFWDDIQNFKNIR